MDERQARRKATDGVLYTCLAAILFTADLAGISHVARDEYAPEVTTILSRLPEAACAADVERIIREEFACWFYPGMTEQHPERFTRAARQMWRAWCAATAAAMSPMGISPVVGRQILHRRPGDACPQTGQDVPGVGAQPPHAERATGQLYGAFNG